MAVSKRLRYEILRRDNHACRYCGGTAPDIPLTVDHVLPVALGGSDGASNLVTACGPCNSGKTSSSPDAPVVADVAEDALRWARAMKRAAEIQDEEHAMIRMFAGCFQAHWKQYGGEDLVVPLSAAWSQSIESMRRAGLTLADLYEATDIAMQARHVAHDHVFRYFCGVAWRKLEQRREIAASLIQAEEAAPDGS